MSEPFDRRQRYKEALREAHNGLLPYEVAAIAETAMAVADTEQQEIRAAVLGRGVGMSEADRLEKYRAVICSAENWHGWTFDRRKTEEKKLFVDGASAAMDLADEENRSALAKAAYLELRSSQLAAENQRLRADMLMERRRAKYLQAEVDGIATTIENLIRMDEADDREVEE